MKYSVTISFPADYEVEVNADSEEDAITLAEEQCSMADSGDFIIYDAYDFNCEKVI